jgi:hypothetical protein
MIATALRKKTLYPARLVLRVTFFCCNMAQWCFFVFWGVLSRLDISPRARESRVYRVFLPGAVEQLLDMLS